MSASALESEVWIQSIGKETRNLLFFLVKMFQPLRILFIMELSGRVSIVTRIICMYVKKTIISKEVHRNFASQNY